MTEAVAGEQTGKHRKPRILSTLPFTKVTLWRESVDSILPSRNLFTPLTGRIGIPDAFLLFRLLRRAHRYDVVLLNGGERVDLVYLAVAGMLPWIRTPHVIVDAHWQVSDSAPGRFLQRLLFRMGRRLTAEVQPHSPEEIEIYHREFGIPREVIRPLPWSTSLTGYDIRQAGPPEPVVVTGGHSFRDYDTLLAAAPHFPWPVEIGLPPSPETERVRALVEQHGNARLVQDWTFQQYWEKVANSQVFAMCIVPGLTRCTADQTILNAMALGTVVVATDAISSRLYIRDGVNGFIVPERSVSGWIDTLHRVAALSPDARARIVEQARHDAQTLYGEEDRLRKTLSRAVAVSGMAGSTAAG